MQWIIYLITPLSAQGETATHAVVFATLFTPDGENHGLHAFFIQIRDTNTLENLPGVTIGDMGEKLGLNGVDNGYLLYSFISICPFFFFAKALLIKSDVTQPVPCSTRCVT